MGDAVNAEACKWVALCAEPAVGWVRHPTLGRVLTCRGHVDSLDLGGRFEPFAWSYPAGDDDTEGC